MAKTKGLVFALAFLFTLTAVAQEEAAESSFQAPEFEAEGPSAESLPEKAESAEDLSIQEDLDEVSDQDLLTRELDPEPVPMVKRKKVDTEGIRSSRRRLIEHPNAKKGLIRITKERDYIYRVEKTDIDSAASVRLGRFNPDQLKNPEHSSVEFDTVYDQSSFPMALYEHEKPFFRKFGRLAYTFGAGFYYAEGTGNYSDPSTNTSEPPLEEYSLFVFPASIGLNYRLQFSDTQSIVPYFGGGADIFFMIEHRDDDNNTDIGVALGAAPAAHVHGGISWNMGSNARSFLDLDREYGINNLSFLTEYRHFIGLHEDYDFTSDYIALGLHVEY